MLMGGKHCPFQFLPLLFSIPPPPDAVIEYIILKEEGKNGREPLVGARCIVCVCRQSCLLIYPGFCVGCKLAISLTHFHSNGHCKAPVRRSWPVSAEEGTLLCYTLKDHLMYYCGARGT